MAKRVIRQFLAQRVAFVHPIQNVVCVQQNNIAIIHVKKWMNDNESSTHFINNRYYVTLILVVLNSIRNPDYKRPH